MAFLSHLFEAPAARERIRGCQPGLSTTRRPDREHREEDKGELLLLWPSALLIVCLK